MAIFYFSLNLWSKLTKSKTPNNTPIYEIHIINGIVHIKSNFPLVNLTNILNEDASDQIFSINKEKNGTYKCIINQKHAGTSGFFSNVNIEKWI